MASGPFVVQRANNNLIDCTPQVPKGQVTAIMGPSGSGKVPKRGLVQYRICGCDDDRFQRLLAASGLTATSTPT